MLDELSKKRPELVKGLESMGNFYMEIAWDFQSWIPLISRILPSDVCRIYKKGDNIRMDTTLLDFNGMKWERGDISFLFRGKGYIPRIKRYKLQQTMSIDSIASAPSSYAFIIMDNRRRVYQRVRHFDNEHDIDHEVDILMSTDIASARINTNPLNFDRVSNGWMFKTDKREKVGAFLADFYAIRGFLVETNKRREHLSEEDLRRNRTIFKTLTNLTKTLETANQVPAIQAAPDGTNRLLFSAAPTPKGRTSLPIPCPPKRPSWVEYISAAAGEAPVLGRPHKIKSNSKMFKAKIAMSQEFPLSVDSLIKLLEIIAPFEQLKKLRDFVKTKLPSGFPVKIEIPMLPTVTAKIMFQEFKFTNDIPDEYFDVPAGYTEGMDAGIDWTFAVVRHPLVEGI